MHPAFSEEDMDAMRHEDACADDAIAAHEDKAWADHAISEDQAAIQAAIDSYRQAGCCPRHRRMQEEERPETWPIMTMMKIMR